MRDYWAWQDLRRTNIERPQSLLAELRRRQKLMVEALVSNPEKLAWRPFGKTVFQVPTLPAIEAHTTRLEYLDEQWRQAPSTVASAPESRPQLSVETKLRPLPDKPTDSRAAEDVALALARMTSPLTTDTELSDTTRRLFRMPTEALVAYYPNAPEIERFPALLALIASKPGIAGAIAAHRLLTTRSLTTTDIAALRQLYDMNREAERHEAADALFELAWAAGLQSFAIAEAHNVASERTIALASLAAAPLLVTSGGLVAAPELPAANRVLVITDIAVSPVLLADLAGEAQSLTVATTLGMEHAVSKETLAACIAANIDIETHPLVSTYAPHYSEAEEELSQISQSIARSITKELQRLAGKNPDLDLLRKHASALEVRLDDTIFANALATWSAMAAIKATNADRVIIAASDSRIAMGLRTIADQHNVAVDIFLQGSLEDPIDPDIAALTDDADENVAARDDLKSALKVLIEAGRASSAFDNLPSDATLIAGRPTDRNFIADMSAIGRSFKTRGPVIIVPTAVRADDGATKAETIAKTLPPESYDHSLLDLLDSNEPMPRTEIKALTHSLFRAVTHELRAKGGIEAAIISSAEVALRNVVNRAVPRMIWTLARAERLIETLKPARVLALPSRDWIARGLILLAKARKIPTYDMQTVFISRRSRYKATPATTQIAIDSYSGEIYHSFLGTPKSNVMVAGAIKYGASREAILAADPTIVRALRPDRTTMIMFAASPLVKDCLPVAEALSRIASRNPKTWLCIKLHPSCDPAQEDAYRAMSARDATGSTVVMPRTSNLSETIAAADIVVTRFSNVGFEAALAGKPVVACNFTNDVVPAPLEAMGIALAAKSELDAEQAFIDISADTPRAKAYIKARDLYLKRNKHLLSPHLADDIVEKILKREDKAHRRKAQPATRPSSVVPRAEEASRPEMRLQRLRKAG